MTWLVRLYPPAWRRRYGRELAELLATESTSFRTVIDVAAGAVDAWLNPQSSTAATAADPKGEPMIPKILQRTCTSAGAGYTTRDALKAAGVTIGGTIVAMVVLQWAMTFYGDNAYLDALRSVSWLVAFLVGQRYTEFKGRSAGVQAVLLGGPAAIVIAIALTSARLNN